MDEPDPFPLARPPPPLDGIVRNLLTEYHKQPDEALRQLRAMQPRGGTMTFPAMSVSTGQYSDITTDAQGVSILLVMIRYLISVGFRPKDPASTLMMAAFHGFGRNATTDEQVKGALYTALYPNAKTAPQLGRYDMRSAMAVLMRPSVLEEVWRHKDFTLLASHCQWVGDHGSREFEIDPPHQDILHRGTKSLSAEIEDNFWMWQSDQRTSATEQLFLAFAFPKFIRIRFIPQGSNRTGNFDRLRRFTINVPGKLPGDGKREPQASRCRREMYILLVVVRIHSEEPDVRLYDIKGAEVASVLGQGSGQWSLDDDGGEFLLVYRLTKSGTRPAEQQEPEAAPNASVDTRSLPHATESNPKRQRTDPRPPDKTVHKWDQSSDISSNDDICTSPKGQAAAQESLGEVQGVRGAAPSPPLPVHDWDKDTSSDSSWSDEAQKNNRMRGGFPACVEHARTPSGQNEPNSTPAAPVPASPALPPTTIWNRDTSDGDAQYAYQQYNTARYEQEKRDIQELSEVFEDEWPVPAMYAPRFGRPQPTHAATLDRRVHTLSGPAAKSSRTSTPRHGAGQTSNEAPARADGPAIQLANIARPQHSTTPGRADDAPGTESATSAEDVEVPGFRRNVNTYEDFV